MTHQNLGSIAAKTGHDGEALHEYDLARAIDEPLVARNPTNAWAAGMLADLYLDIGIAEERIDGQPTRACRSYRKADEAFRRLRAANRLHDVRSRNADEAARRAGLCGGGDF
jgi:hypothetical protein